MNFDKLMKKINVELVIAFGSQITGNANRNSDVDIAVLRTQNLNLKERGGLTDSLAKQYQFNEDKIDLVEIKNASPLLRFQISKHGKLLWGNKEIYNRFKILAWRQYLDTERLREVRKTILKKWVETK